jgi:hypothetical protein
MRKNNRDLVASCCVNEQHACRRKSSSNLSKQTKRENSLKLEQTKIEKKEF